MLLNKLFRKAKTIKKPSFPLEVTKSFLFMVALCIVVLLVFRTPIEDFIDKPQIEAFEAANKCEDLFKRYIATHDEVILEEAIDQANHLTGYITYKLEIDGEVLFDNSDSYFITYYDKENEIFYHYTGKWCEDRNEEYNELYKYSSMDSDVELYAINPRDVYIDDETGIVYPGVVDVYHYIWIDDLFHKYNENPNLVFTIDLTPDDSIIANTRHQIASTVSYSNMDIGAPSTYRSDRTLRDSWTTNESHGSYRNLGEPGHHHDSYYNLDHAINSSNFRVWAIFWITTIVVVIIAFIAGTINYFKRKSVYEIFEYRRKTTEAMAHDLKTPLAAISLSASNLKENLGVNPSKCEIHATNIENTVAYANDAIENILEFSKSEIPRKKINVITIDIREEITKQINSLESSLKAKNMEIEVLGGGVVNTDLDLWNQAISNLLVNAIKHGLKGTKIRVGIESSEEKGKLISSRVLTISNSIEEDIEDVTKLKEPFTKGSNSRGENSGNGLGLAISDNNLSELGYKLKVEVKDKTFVATILR